MNRAEKEAFRVENGQSYDTSETRYLYGWWPAITQTLLTSCSMTAPLKVSHLCIIYHSNTKNILVISGLVRLKVHMTMAKMKESGENNGSNSIGEDSYKDTDSDKNSHRIVI